MQAIDGDDQHYNILAQRYDATGQAFGDPIKVETDPLDQDQGLPQVAAGDDGAFTVAWTSPNDGDGTRHCAAYLCLAFRQRRSAGEHPHHGRPDRRRHDPAVGRLLCHSVAGQRFPATLRGQHFDATGQATGSRIRDWRRCGQLLYDRGVGHGLHRLLE
ncbi:MAG: hypothetical protein WDN06_15315 [Asticcacaulis sp.]